MAIAIYPISTMFVCEVLNLKTAPLNMNDVVTIRDFTRNIYRHMKEGKYIVTKDGAPEFVVTIEKANDYPVQDVNAFLRGIIGE